MKTFEEAVAITLKNETLLTQNLRSSMAQMQQCEQWSKEIMACAESTLRAIAFRAKDHDGTKLIAEMCSSLHVMFDWGKLVGMEIEK